MAYVPNVVERTADAVTQVDFINDLYGFFNNSSSHWNVVNSNTDSNNKIDAFTIEPSSTDHDFHINLRENSSASFARGVLDPGASISDAGNKNTAPSISSGLEHPETAAFRSDEIGNTTYYITEGDEFVQLLFMDANESHTPNGCQIGKVINRFWKNLGPGFAFISHDPQWGSIDPEWLSDAATWVELESGDWRQPSGKTTRLERGWDKSGVLGVPVVVYANQSNGERAIGVTRYGKLTTSPHSPGTVLDSGNMAFVSVNADDFEDISAVIWDPNVTPLFQ